MNIMRRARTAATTRSTHRDVEDPRVLRGVLEIAMTADEGFPAMIDAMQ